MLPFKCCLIFTNPVQYCIELCDLKEVRKRRQNDPVTCLKSSRAHFQRSKMRNQKDIYYFVCCLFQCVVYPGTDDRKLLCSSFSLFLYSMYSCTYNIDPKIIRVSSTSLVIHGDNFNNRLLIEFRSVDILFDV